MTVNPTERSFSIENQKATPTHRGSAKETYLASDPRALPWAISFRAFGASTRRAARAPITTRPLPRVQICAGRSERELGAIASHQIISPLSDCLSELGSFLSLNLQLFCIIVRVPSSTRFREFLLTPSELKTEIDECVRPRVRISVIPTTFVNLFR